MPSHPLELDCKLLAQVVNGNKQSVEQVLMAGACVDGSRHLPTRPLVAAAQTGQVGMIEVLIGRGADVEVAVSNEMCDDDGDILFPLGTRALHAAAFGRFASSVRCLLNAGANPDVTNSAGSTPLMLANNSSEVVAELLKGGANPAFANGTGTTALHMFAFNGARNKAMRLLVEAAPSTLNQV